MQLYINDYHFKKIIILFWTFWWLIALWTDVIGGLSHLHLIEASFAPDTNYPFLVSSLAMYHPPQWLPALFYIGIVCWSALSFASFAYATAALRQNESLWHQRATIAFIISLTYWFAFLLADQMIMNFDLEENHMVQAGFELLTFFYFFLHPQHQQNE